MAIAEQDVRTFFNEYGQALGSRDAKAIAKHWGIPSLVVSDQGTVPVASSEEVEAFFSSSMQQYEGVAEARANIERVAELSENVVAAEIEWQHKDDQGRTRGGERGHYMLSRQNGRLSIVVYAPKTA